VQKTFKPKLLTDIAGKIVVVTGAGGQLGAEIVSALLLCGAKVVAIDNSSVAIEKKFNGVKSDSKSVLILTADISKSEEVSAAFAESTVHFGKIDHLVNNAGVSVFEPFLERTEESIDMVMDVNLKGTFFCIREYLRQIKTRGESRGAIVNIASHYGLISPDPRIYTDCDRKNSEIYGATKAGIIQMTRYFAVHATEFGVRVNAVSPGGVRDPGNPQGVDFQRNYGYRCPMGRMAETSEIIGPIIFLLSPAASYVTGQNIVVDGGMTSW
jgi:NAD(P)-dependent dehydrogenase (short-subunit alcohol dehydrogenase family)